MRAGQPLTDMDLARWLELVTARCRWKSAHRRRRERDHHVLRVEALLSGRDQSARFRVSCLSTWPDSRETIAERLAARQGHFSAVAPARRRFDVLEEPGPDEPHIRRSKSDTPQKKSSHEGRTLVEARSGRLRQERVVKARTVWDAMAPYPKCLHCAFASGLTHSCGQRPVCVRTFAMLYRPAQTGKPIEICWIEIDKVARLAVEDDLRDSAGALTRRPLDLAYRTHRLRDPPGQNGS